MLPALFYLNNSLPNATEDDKWQRVPSQLTAGFEGEFVGNVSANATTFIQVMAQQNRRILGT